MTIRIRQNALQGLQFTATASSHDLPIDMPPPEGDGPDPHDLFDTSLGACKALTVTLYARRKGIPLMSIDVDVQRDDSEERKGVYRLKTVLTLNGDLTEEQRQELLNVAGRCPVHKLMTQTEIQVSAELAPA
ncbi:OsmC family protein [Achromobacter aloeverae]|uniref:Osmotically inducible protein OsmC n=1 Tax=Achromobacter aloeverae TaxID=1750518 RepID=A0A4Q1HF13_9BURK|nr:OsmC family protein [Achromobacter aloeverae]RXN84439.1 osmotically inducible protein OsmC [Achromobacter aloeverae]